MELFSIVCPTCNARLKVRDAAAIGQILNCPKCASMVHVAAPAGWQPPAADAANSAAPQQAGGSPTTSGRRWENEVQPGEKVLADIAATPGSGGLRLGDSSSGVSSLSSSNVSGMLAGAESGRIAGEAAPGQRFSFAPAAVAQILSAGWMKWAALGGVPVIVVAVATGIWLSRRPPEAEEAPPAVVDTTPAVVLPVQDKQAAPPVDTTADSEPVRLSRRWLPTASQTVVSLRPKIVFAQPAARVMLDRTAALWQPAIDKLASSLGLDPQTFERATWSSIEIAEVIDDNWLTQGVLVVELDRPIDAASRGLRDSEPLDWKLDQAPGRALKSHAWPHPFAVIDKRVIVTGPEEQLRELAVREEHRLANDALEQLIDSLDARSAAVAIVDLRVLREAEVLPVWLPLIDLFHADADDWKLLRAMPLGLGLAVGLDEQIDLEVDLACDGESSAEQVQAALDRVLASVEGTLASEAEGLTNKLLAGQINAALAGELKHFLSGSQSALAGRTLGVRDSIAWARLDWHGDLPKLAAGFLASVPQLEASRLAAARQLDEAHHRLLIDGLAGYVKAEGGLPAGAAGATLLPPETRLSWQATLLPYYGHLDWHGELNFARPWNDPLNQRVTRRPLELMVNPALGPSTTKAGFPVTHYVGVAGLGDDAGQLDADDPRAGVFGFRPRYSPVQIPDGASNTIALAGVSQKVGPWASGGGATVRGLTQRPYVNGPDGFGSGQPDGMLVSMADGSVRFLSKEMDPAVLERLVTVAGGESPVEALAESTKPVIGPPAEEMPARPKPAKVSTKQPPAEIAVHLNDRIPQIELSDTTLGEVVDLLSQLSTVPITLDVDALAAAGVDADAKVSLSLSDTTVGEVLDAALRRYDLKYITVGDQLIVTDARQAADALESTTLNVDDLAGAADQSEEQVARLIETFVAPTAWQSAGGAGSIEAADGKLTIEQTPAIAAQAADFLDKLRMARELPIARREGRRLSLATRWARAGDKLATKVTANFPEPTPLKAIAVHLQKAAGVEIAFDGLGMAAAEVSPTDRGKLSANRVPLGDALQKLLEPLKLGYRIVNGQTFEITSARELAEDLEMELYPVKSLLSAGGNARSANLEDFASRIRKDVAPSSWREYGGAGTLTIDAASSYLIVLAPQPVQIELERWLDEQAQGNKAR